jgi:hypothetical protein
VSANATPKAVAKALASAVVAGAPSRGERGCLAHAALQAR